MAQPTPLQFFHEHLGQYLLPDASPYKSLAPSLPTRTKAGREAQAKDPSAPLPVTRIGTGMPVYYIVTPERSWFLSNTEAPIHEKVEAVRIDTDEGKAAIKGNQFIAYWLYHQAPMSPFMIGQIEKADPLPSLAISRPPTHIQYGTTSTKLGVIVCNLLDFREAVTVIKESGIPWADIKKANASRERVKLSARGSLPASVETHERKAVEKLRSKHPDLFRTLKEAPYKPGSGEETFLHWYFNYEAG